MVYPEKKKDVLYVRFHARIEDVEHFILKFMLFREERNDLFSLLQRLEDIQKRASILQVAAKVEGVVVTIEKTWIKMFQCQT